MEAAEGKSAPARAGDETKGPVVGPAPCGLGARRVASLPAEEAEQDAAAGCAGLPPTATPPTNANPQDAQPSFGGTKSKGCSLSEHSSTSQRCGLSEHSSIPQRCGLSEHSSIPQEGCLSVPASALQALDVLEGAGFESWIVGGFVRDALMGRPSADTDIATCATWQQAQAAFEAAGLRTHETGTAHGTLTAIVGDDAFEVTTFRADGAYRDGRHPEHVTFVRSIEEDLARRDFTVNALAYHPQRGLLDPYGGAADLQQGVLRAVGDPHARFGEDALRILRGCRFASQLGFAIEPGTFQGMMERKNLLWRISAERVLHELDRFVTGQHIHDALMSTADVLAAVLPELVAAKGFDQRTPYHIYDVLEHTAYVMQNTPPARLVRWAALFHDLGKPASFFADADGTGHFYGHAHISTMLAEGVMRRLKMAPSFAGQVLALVRSHDDVIEPTPKAVKRALMRLGGDTGLFAALCDLKRGDALAQAPRCRGRVALADRLEEVLEGILAAEDAFDLRHLAVNGHDVMAAGVPAGPAVGEALAAALMAVVDEQVENSPEALRAFVAAWAAGQAEGGRE